MRTRLVAALLLCAPLAPAAAQAAGSATFESWRPGAPADLRPVPAAPLGTPPRGEVGPGMPRVVAGASAGAALGVLAGGLIGYQVDRATGCNDDWCGLDGILIGGSIGSTLLAPAGAHLANNRRGRLTTSLLATAASTGLTWLVAEATGVEEIVLAVPFVNIVAAAVAERTTTPPSPANR